MQVVTVEPGEGFRLATYATWWIRPPFQEYILRSWSLVRWAHANQKKLFFNLRKAKEQDFRTGGGRPAPRPGVADRKLG